MKAAEHITHHARALDRFGRRVAVRARVTQAHALHGIQNAPLHRLHAVADVGQRAALDDRQRVFKVGALGVAAQRVGVVPWRGEIKNQIVHRNRCIQRPEWAKNNEFNSYKRLPDKR